MYPLSTQNTLLPLAAFLLPSLVSAHGVILAAQGEADSPPSVGFMVNDAIARNCTSINPCQMDTTIIRDAEIAAGTVNSCGRTKLNGNIDVGTVTENALAEGAVTAVRQGSSVDVTIHQVNADGAGPYTCDLDEGSNSGIMSHELVVSNNIPGQNGLSQAAEQEFTITVTMPDDMKCIGGSTGNVCTVRCRNAAQAGPFGGLISPPFPTHFCPALIGTDTVMKDASRSNKSTLSPLSTPPRTSPQPTRSKQPSFRPRLTKPPLPPLLMPTPRLALRSRNKTSLLSRLSLR
ncbi:uncharacterized protein PODANS_5_3780 [Podospora anserina S mat+]|uniref:Podospora anserina S mat+ genomic DNA chromosome 5, supercontig 4 n=1 Tax=Podospora anserina (strain S / ATCC MYA-4624 / DSM 980 / FGSC 10383) TaxID=515849 RepID=B2ALJ1_PODAN|nr:uncharacterized protein PODANS_5_3780 [Podospora anserina S mat+]CAP64829.1 unnamed protein product [Podospora anserina S mat+]CDP29339.1 Putative protein of unknown function [Podospora anserina S mat+]